VESGSAQRVLPGAYEQLAIALVDGLGLQRFHWVGTSMGGAIGMVAAAGACADASSDWCSTTWARRSPPPRWSASAAYAGNPAAFATVSELEQYFRTVYKPYGFLTDAQWRR
jgi:pimeloyl-ACP methyl ester carboxylesterase